MTAASVGMEVVVEGAPRLDFPRAEYVARLARAQRLMAARGVDGLILSTPAGLRYFTGHTTHRWMQVTAPQLALLPADGAPILLLPANEVPRAAELGWVSDIRPLTGFSAIGVAETVDALHERGLGEGMIAAETGTLFRLGMSVDDFLALRLALPRARFADAAEIVWPLRMRKSAAEVARLGRAVEITHRAVDRLYSVAAPGMTEIELFRLLVAALMEEGADWPGSVPLASRSPDEQRAWDNHLRLPSARPVTRGDLIWLDAGCIAGGYWSDTMRMASLGKAPAMWRDAYRFIREACHACIAEAVPGAPVSRPIAAYARMIEDSPYAAAAPRLRTARIAHGIGLDLIEPPSLSFSDPSVLEPGTVLTIEPSFYLPGIGFFMVEEDVLVSEEGPVILGEPAPAELPEL